MSIERVVIPHKYREERRAVHIPAAKAEFKGEEMTPKFLKESEGWYEESNGNRPRGEGAWAFSLHRDGAATTVRFSGNYAECKRCALYEAKQIGCTKVTLES